MEKITYQKLKAGYILKKDDIIDTLHGFEGLEVTAMCGKCWLHNHNGTNSAIYEYLGIADPKLECAAPEFKSAEELTEHVISLFEMSPYKVGDKVRILEREKNPSDYPFSFVGEMEEYVGNIFTIKRIEFNNTYDKDKYNGDFHKYILDEPSEWCWHSSMFEKVDSDSEIKEEPVPEKKYKYEDDQRLTICGKTYRVHRNKDSNFLVSLSSWINRQVFIDLGIISKVVEEDKLMDWIKKHGFNAGIGSFPPIKADQFDDFVDLLLQTEKDQGTVYQCSSKDSYKLGDRVRLGEDEYEISSNSRGYYLCNRSHGGNNKMFTDLGIIAREWLKSHDFDYNDLGMFPEQRTLERLNEVIKALQKEFVIRKECKSLKEAILAAAKPVPYGHELVWSLSDETSASPEKLKFAKKKKNIHITL